MSDLISKNGFYTVHFTLTVRFYGEFGMTCKNEKKHNYVDVSLQSSFDLCNGQILRIISTNDERNLNDLYINGC